MIHDFRNVYADDERAESYARLEYPGTYYLAFRDLPAVIERHTSGRAALDFGCGAGRSSRFLQELGYSVVGVDISAPMLARARARDPGGDYRLVPDGDLSDLAGTRFDLVLSTFTFDNIPVRENRLRLFSDLGQLLSHHGRLINLVSSPDIYLNEWASFSTKDFPENRSARSGNRVRIGMLDVEDRRPVEDVMWTDSDYRDLYAAAGLDVLETHRPLGRSSDPRTWVSETRISPWVIYVLGRCGT
ncbi:MAG: methyltransferase domain-containing protein [Gemmatimonadota bacterium]|nr:methyltransferase domain-containing protein [Gemmatimonadota bacterium]